MKAPLRIALRIPAGGPPDLLSLRRFVERAETLGFDAIWAGDHVFHHTDILQPFDLLSWVAAQTTRLRLGTSVVLAAYLNPVLLARDAASLDYLSDGRFTLGVSLGGSPDEYSSLGVPIEQRLGRLLENVTIMRRLWQEDEVDFAGRYHQISHASVRPKPVQQPLPVYFAGRSEAMLRRLPAVADGWIASSHYSGNEFLEGVRTLRRACSEAGVDPGRFGIAKVQDVSVNANRNEALRRAERHWHRYYGPAYEVERLVSYGTPDQCRQQLAALSQTDAPEVTLILEPASLDLEELALLHEATLGLNQE